MKANAGELQTKVKELLEAGTIGQFIGYETGSDSLRVTPCFLKSGEEASRLVWGPLCVNNLAKYLLDFKNVPGKVGIILKGCDSRSVVELLKENQIDREKVFIVGVPCTGIVDREKLLEVMGVSSDEMVTVEDEGESFVVTLKDGKQRVDKEKVLRDECLVCRYPSPVIYDVLVGKPVSSLPWVGDDYSMVKEQEALSSEEKAAYWNRELSQCIRCYACRNICPACTCSECIFDKKAPRWISKANDVSENLVYHLIRVFHVAGRCVDCGECERACPMNIPLRSLNEKVEKDLLELFDYVAGVDVDQRPPLTTYQVGDLDEFL
ncbi:MAG: Coenzyme F420 hydrogenase/dehydrogenase, beta subunit C-terminal domain [Dehalococcoidia bacterium]